MAIEAIILASSRKGTHLLQTSLAQHPDVLSHDQYLRWPHFYPNDTGVQLAERLFATDKTCVVVPLDFWAARDRYPGFWDELRRRAVKVIHLHRRNMLQWYVSVKIADRTKQWISYTAAPTNGTGLQIHVDLKEFTRMVMQNWRKERQGRRFFASHEQLHVWYERLAHNWEEEILDVQEFLGVRPLPIRPTCYKQERRPLWLAVDNFWDVHDALLGTPWEHFVTDDGPVPQVHPDRE